MPQRIVQFALLVREYDEAIDFYTNKLGFVLREDSDFGNGKRWVRVAPAEDSGLHLLLSRATTERQRERVGDQTGGRVVFFLETDDLERDYQALSARGVTFPEPPRGEPYGRVAVLLDLYGNRIDLIEPALPVSRSAAEG